MTDQEAHGQAFENGRKKGDAEGYARGKAEAFAEAGDLISRKALLDVIAETAEGLADCDQQNAAWALRKYAVRDIEDAPAVTARPVKRGQWFRTDRENVYGGIEIQCSECGHTLMTSPRHIDEEYFCCHCGADMRGESDA